MADPRGFLKYSREDNPKRPIEERRTDWHELYAPLTDPATREGTQTQAARCMDCGIPFCHSGGAGCPLGNLIPEWNDFVRRGEWDRASERLHATNNFPEFTGALCPAPCEAACVLSITSQPGPVAIKRVEWSIAENGLDRRARRPADAEQPHRASRRRRRVGARGARRGPAAHARRARRHRLRARRPPRRAHALRHPGVQVREVGARPPARPDARRGHPVRDELRGRHRGAARGAAAGRARRRGARRRRARGPRRPHHRGPRPRRRAPGDGVPRARQPRVRGRRPVADQRPRGERRHHRRRRHGSGLLRHRDPPGRAGRPPARPVPPPPKTRQDSSSPWPTWPYVFRTPPALEEGGERLFATAVPPVRGRRARPRPGGRALVGRGAPGRRRAAGGRADLGGGARDAVRPRAVLHRLHGPRRPGAPARPRDRAQPQGRGRLRLGLADRRARRVRLRRRPPRCVADRVGDRRGPLGRRGRRPLPRPRRHHRPPGPPAPRRAAPVSA